MYAVLAPLKQAHMLLQIQHCPGWCVVLDVTQKNYRLPSSSYWKADSDNFNTTISDQLSTTFFFFFASTSALKIEY